ncbi:protein grainyhead-like, partial [Diaphorina citri]|uniref:Protein grainyhead-like n=1 Tax=Diaphorina citri TaxID=121845 RepID=A0A1S3DJU1_DIACI
MTATGRKKMDELYHPPCERSEFYTMADTTKPPVLFSPAEDIDKLNKVSDKKELEQVGLTTDGTVFSSLPLKRPKLMPPLNERVIDKKELEQVGLTTDGTVFSSLPLKRPKLMPPLNERVMLYVRQESDEIYTPLHVSPPTTQGLLNA